MKQRKIQYLIELSRDATPAELCHIVTTLALKRFIRKYKLQRLFDGIITGVAVFFLFEISNPGAHNILPVLVSTLFGCYIVLSGGFYLPTKTRSRSNSAD